MIFRSDAASDRRFTEKITPVVANASTFVANASTFVANVAGFTKNGGLFVANGVEVVANGVEVVANGARDTAIGRSVITTEAISVITQFFDLDKFLTAT